MGFAEMAMDQFHMGINMGHDRSVAVVKNGEILVAIEQEMLAVRRLYVDGHVIKDVYVSETRRLYAKALATKNSQCE